MVAAVTLLARTIEILAPELQRDLAVLGLRGLARGDVALGLLRQGPEQVDLAPHHAVSVISLWARASPSSSGVQTNSGKALWSAVTSKLRWVTGAWRGVP